MIYKVTYNYRLLLNVTELLIYCKTTHLKEERPLKAN